MYARSTDLGLHDMNIDFRVDEVFGCMEPEQRSCIEGTKYRIRLQITHTNIERNTLGRRSV